MRWAFNFFPAFRGTGAWITYIAWDYLEVRVRLPLSWRTRNYVGTIFGGSMYAAVDPFFMIMLIKRLGPRYVVWDKAASIRFRKPGRSTLYARFVISAYFAPSCGIDEDPVTGSAHCALGPYWSVRLGVAELLAYQASARGGIVRVRPRGDRVLLGGQAVTVLRGEIYG